MFDYKKLARRICIYLITLIFFALIFFVFGSDSEDWTGFTKEEDDTPAKKFANRLYFTILSFSTIGYGDIAPKAPHVKAITAVMALVVMTELLTFVFEFKWRSIKSS